MTEAERGEYNRIRKLESRQKMTSQKKYRVKQREKNTE